MAERREQMDKLPKSWKNVTIEDVCHKITDGTHKTPKYVKDGVPFLSVKNITNGFIDFSDTKFVTQKEHEVLIKRCNPEINDVLYTKVGTTGVAKVIDTNKDFSIFVSLALLKPNFNLIESRFFEYLLNSPNSYKQAQSRTRGVANRNLVLKDIKAIDIPLPPLPEQKRIVSKLDALFARIDKSIALLEENIKQTEHLMASALDEVFSSVPVEKYLPILDVCSIANKSIIPIGNESYNYVGLENIESQTGRLAEFSKTNGNEIKSSKVVFWKGAVLYGKLRPYLNKVYIADFDGICTTEILPFYPNNEILYKEYLAFYLRSEKFVNEVNNNTSGARMPRATTTFFKNVAKIPVPTLATQKMDVDKLTSLSTRIFLLQAEQQAKLNNLKALKESILDKAFKGEL
jgi:type I restriction enzyme S subunit